MGHLKQLAYLLKLTCLSWVSHDATRIGAALAYYALLSLAPMVMLSIAVGSRLFGGTAMEQHLVQEVRVFAGGEVAGLVTTMAAQARNPSSGALFSFLGLLTLLLGASGVFAELRSALNTMWDIQPRGSNGIWEIVKDRLISVGMVIAVGFLLILSLVLSTSLAFAGRFLSGLLPVPVWILDVLNFFFSLSAITGMFALVFRYAPDARMPWREIWVGSGVSAFLFTLGKSLIGFYLGRAAVGSLYGASGSTIAVTVWVYYSALLFLFGAEFTRVRILSGIAVPGHVPI